MFSGFQSNAYQSNAYQILRGSTPIVSGGGKPQSYELGKHAWRVAEFKKAESQRIQAEADLVAKNREIEALEKRRAKLLADQAMQAEILRMMLEAKALEDERLRLMALVKWFMREEEEIFILLSCLPFKS